MALSTAWTFGQQNAAGDTLANFLKVFTGEVQTAFRRDVVTEGLFRTRTIANGKSGQFKVTARTDAVFHERGDAIDEDANTNGTDYLDNMKVAEIVVGIDRALTRGFFFDELDEAMDPANDELRMEASFAAGEAIARTVDRRRLIALGLGAQAASGYNTDLPGGTEITDANMFSTVADTIESVEEMAAAFDNNYVPKSDRYMFVRPDEYYWMVSNLRDYIINRDYGGAGSVAAGKVSEIHGFQIISTTNMPYNENVATDPAGTGASSLNTYTGDFSNVVCMFGQRQALGVLQLAPFVGGPQGYEIEQKRRFGHILGAKWYGGTKFLRPECCGLVKTA